MRRKKNGHKTVVETELNFVALVLMIVAAGFYIKGSMGIKTGTELALENIKTNQTAMLQELRAYALIATGTQMKCENLEARVVNLESIDVVTLKGVQP